MPVRFHFRPGRTICARAIKIAEKNIIQIAKNQRFIANFRVLLKQIMPCAADPRVRVKYATV